MGFTRGAHQLVRPRLWLGKYLIDLGVRFGQLVRILHFTESYGNFTTYHVIFIFTIYTHVFFIKRLVSSGYVISGDVYHY